MIEAEVLPGACREEIGTVMMQEIVGDYDTPDAVPEWDWVKREACFAHVRNGQNGIWEFILNLSQDWPDIPERLKAVISQSRQSRQAYLIFHQGT